MRIKYLLCQKCPLIREREHDSFLTLTNFRDKNDVSRVDRGTGKKEMLYRKDVVERVYNGFPGLESLLSRIFVLFLRVHECEHEPCSAISPGPSLYSRLPRLCE